MRAISQIEFSILLRQEHIKSRLSRELRFVPEEVAGWKDRELLAVSNRSGNEGLLLLALEHFYVLPFTISKRITNKQTGRSTPVTCDFCYTWQKGDNAGSITFTRPGDGHTITFLCCADLDCSLHVRDETPASIMSRVQLHEDMTSDQRIERLHRKLEQLVGKLGAQPAQMPSDT